jgi:hypothetical protein
MTRTPALVTLAVAGTLALSGCAGSSLEDDDPTGFAACRQFSAARAAGDGETRMVGFMAAGKLASEAATEAIRAAAKPMFDEELAAALAAAGAGEGFWVVDATLMLEACTDAGVDVAKDVLAD